MKYQILLLVCVLAFATTASADPMVEVSQFVRNTLDDILNLIQHPTLANALAVLANNGWAALAPYVGGYVRMQSYDDFHNKYQPNPYVPIDSGDTEDTHYTKMMNMILTLIKQYTGTTNAGQ